MYRKLAVAVFVAFLLAPSVFGQRLGHPSAKPVVNFQGAISAEMIGDPKNPVCCGSQFFLYNYYLPQGMKVIIHVRRPDGSLVYLPDGSLDPKYNRIGILNTPGNVVSAFGGDVWYGPIPADWIFETLFDLLDGRTYRVFTKASGDQKGLTTHEGWFKGATADPSGGVILDVDNPKTPLVVYAPRRDSLPVTLQGDRYIPPSQMLSGHQTLVVCSGPDGNPYDLECKTVTVEVPVHPYR
jgi:hypothetical protein